MSSRSKNTLMPVMGGNKNGLLGIKWFMKNCFLKTQCQHYIICELFGFFFFFLHMQDFILTAF